ncbi:hypothetical protein BH10ACT7_BH10ACT7_22440 [soil metagenome]
MTPRLPPVLSGDDLPLVELNAARLDGELFRIDGGFAPIDEIEQPHHRALALSADLPARLIAEQGTAAWIWGALSLPPWHHQLCAAVGARVRPPFVSWMTVREVVIEPTEVVTIAGMQVTTLLRTAVDITRFSERFDNEERQVVLELMRVGGLSLQECVTDIESRRNLPNKHRALERLSRC